MSKNLVCLDIECLPNYFLAVFKSLNSGKVIKVDIYGESASLSKEQRKKIHTILSSRTTFGYNSTNYDMPMLNYALSGATCKELYQLSKTIIEKGQPCWITYKSVEQRNYDHFDIQEPAPAVMISLKNYGTRVGSKKLQEFYLDPNKAITKEQVQGLNEYCLNDVDVTIDLYESIKNRIDLREEMSEQYKQDLRSKSDAQIAETVLVSELKYQGKKPELANNYTIKYKAPECIKFRDKTLQDAFEFIKNHEFTLDGNGSPKLPKELVKPIVFARNKYKLGIGGLHSQEKSIAVRSDPLMVLRNADVASYYPSMILEFKWFPKHLGAKFLDVYRKIYETRLEAKRTGNKVVNESLKIVLNGSFGKLGSKYSKLYSPDLMLQVTLTGQLMLLMLIEELEYNNIAVISSNTDGVEYFCRRDKVELAEAIIFDWELSTGMVMEHGEYKGLYAKDVNNYVAVYDGYTKAKGIYAETTLSKGRSTPIVYTAIREHLLNGVGLEEVIRKCKDVNEFVSARTVKGGGEYKAEYLGKMVRWYYSTDGDKITYASNGNLVPKTAEGNGVKPMMDLTDDIPTDLDYEWYINEAISKLKDLGVDYVIKR